MGASPVFVCYARADKQFVQKLCADLKKSGLDIWLDETDITPGDPWDDAIERALEDSARLMVVLSKSSVKSENVKDEVARAMKSGKQIIPVLMETCNIPMRLDPAPVHRLLQGLRYRSLLTNYVSPK